MSGDTKTPVGLLTCNFGKCRRHMKTKNIKQEGQCCIIIWFYQLGCVRESIRFDEGLTLETSVFESLYGGPFKNQTRLKPNYLVILPIDTAPQFH